MTINFAGQLMDMSTPRVMGIVNATPDSFHASSRAMTAEEVVAMATKHLAEGADILDIGACSTRPGSTPVGENEEKARLDMALSAIRDAHPEALVSVDTFRASIARHCVEQWGVQMINDIGGGDLDAEMFDTVASLGVPYVLMHGGSKASTLPENVQGEEVAVRVCQFFEERLQRLHEMGVADIILDPGFGFGKTMAQNYALFARLADIVRLFPHPILVGVSRKRMVWELLHISPDEALPGTSLLHSVALGAGASLLRVHDVGAASQLIAQP